MFPIFFESQANFLIQTVLYVFNNFGRGFESWHRLEYLTFGFFLWTFTYLQSSQHVWSFQKSKKLILISAKNLDWKRKTLYSKSENFSPSLSNNVNKIKSNQIVVGLLLCYWSTYTNLKYVKLSCDNF